MLLPDTNKKGYFVLNLNNSDPSHQISSMNNHEQFQQMGMGSGLTRYRSAPSSYFASFTNSNGGFGEEDFAQLFNPRASSPETQLIFSRFMNGADPIQQTCPSNMAPPPPPQLQRQRSHDYSSSSQMMYANHNSEAAPDSAAVDGEFASFTSNCAAAAQPKMERPATLIRHSSSPAGLFANINIENEASFSSASKLMTRMDYSSRHTSSGMMDPIQEIGSKDMEENAGDDEDHGNDVDYITGLPAKSWDDSVLMSDHYLNGVADHDNKSFYNADASDDQKNEAADRPKTLLSHHLSLPKSSELSAMEKLLQDSVPFKIRAKRGCATHPRSIAERVRRTKISKRMSKLQEVVPNMEKQTNTSDMLDLAVDYIKELQRQVKMLSDNQANCNCSAKRRR